MRGQRLAGVVLAVIAIAAMAFAMLTRGWWGGDSGNTHYEVGIQSYKACWMGYQSARKPRDQWECEAIRFAGRVNRMNVSQKEVREMASERELSEDDERELAENKAALQKFDNFASFGLFAGLFALLMMAGLGVAIAGGLLGRANAARPGGWLAAVLGVLVIVLTIAFYKAQPFDAFLKESGREALSRGPNLFLMLGGAAAGVIGGVLLARMQSGHPLFKFLPANPLAFDDDLPPQA